MPHAHPKRDRLVDRIPDRGKVLESTQSLLEAGLDFQRYRTVQRFRSGLLAIGHSLIPHLPPQGMLRQAFDLFRQVLGVEPFAGLDNARVQRPTLLLKQAAVDDLQRERMLKRAFELWKEVRLVEKFGGLQVRERSTQGLFRECGHGLQQCEGDVLANYRRGLQEGLLLSREPIYPGG